MWIVISVAGVVSDWMGYVSTAVWFLEIAAPPYIYLVVNETIRAELVLLLLGGSRPRKSTTGAVAQPVYYTATQHVSTAWSGQQRQ